MYTKGMIISKKYQVIKTVGQGGSGRVYLVKHLLLEEEMALKVMGLSHQEGVDQLSEAKVLLALKHTYLPQVRDVFIDEGQVHIVRDYLEGDSLQSLVDSRGPIALEDLNAYLSDLVNVLAYLHHRPVPFVHRDIKPSNILIGPDGHVYLIDFGTTRSYKSLSQCDTVALGTVGYAAPEQYGLGQSEPRTDIYGLGMTLYFAYTGENFEQDVLSSNDAWAKFVSKEALVLKAIIKKCTATDPDDRYGSVDEIPTLLGEELNQLYPSPQAIREAKHLPKGRISIGVMGVSSGCGVTHICFSLARWLKDHGYAVSYFSKEENTHLQSYEAFLEGDCMCDDATTDFSVRGIKIHLDGSHENLLHLYSKKGHSLVVDYGSYHFYRQDFLAKDIKVLVVPSAAWAIKNKPFIEEMYAFEDVMFAFNLCDDKDLTTLSAWLRLDKKRCISVPYLKCPLVDANKHHSWTPLVPIVERKTFKRLFRRSKNA